MGQSVYLSPLLLPNLLTIISYITVLKKENWKEIQVWTIFVTL